MSDLSPYRDLRREFFKGYFEKALSFKEYVETGTETEQTKWNGFGDLVSLSDSQQEVASSFVRKMNVLVLSGIWCGDCSRQGPMLQSIAEASDVIDLRFVESQNNPELQEELRINGATKVPVGRDSI